MVVVGHAPPADLAFLVKRFLVVRSAETVVNHLLPTSGVTLVFRVRGTIEDVGLPGALPPCVVTGPRDFPRSVVYTPGTLAYVVDLVPGAASSLVPGPLEDLWGTTRAQGDPVAPPFDVEEALRSADEAEALGVLANHLRRCLRDHRPHRLVEDARALVAQSAPRLSVGRLVDTLGTNKDSLEKSFRRDWGATPKVVLRVERLRALIASLDAAPSGTTWAHRAAEWGYADQSHLNHEFRALVGRAPQDFLQGRRW